MSHHYYVPAPCVSPRGCLPIRQLSLREDVRSGLDASIAGQEWWTVRQARDYDEGKGVHSYVHAFF
jgi:hypothetical protein